jgi:hypothetical protein
MTLTLHGHQARRDFIIEPACFLGLKAAQGFLTE